MVELLVYTEKVGGSNPSVPTNLYDRITPTVRGKVLARVLKSILVKSFEVHSK